MRSVALIVLVFAAATSAVTYDPFSFCERYAAALFTQDAAGETSLITAVIGRVVSGNTAANVTGVLNQPIEKAFFNGTRNPTGINYYTNTNQATALVNNLINFFEVAMKCRAITNTNPLSNMNTVHAAMLIDQTVWDNFIGQVVATLASFGVPLTTTGPTSEVAYLVALTNQFLKGAPQAICTASNCAAYQAFAEFTSGKDDSNNFVWLADDGTKQVTIAPGGNVHWNIKSANHFVVEATSDWQVKSGGFASSTATGGSTTYTMNFPTAGTYYFMCGAAAHQNTMRGTIVVTAGGSGAASVSASLAVVLAAIAAAFMAGRF